MDNKLLKLVSRLRNGLEPEEVVELLSNCSDTEREQLSLIIITYILRDLSEIRAARMQEAAELRSSVHIIHINDIRIRTLYSLFALNLFLTTTMVASGTTILGLPGELLIGLIVSMITSFGTWFLSKNLANGDT